MNNENNDQKLDFLIKNMAAEHQPALPSPGVIWWRAQIMKKYAEKERIERPLATMRVLAAVFIAAVAVALWISRTEGMRAILARVDGSIGFLAAGAGVMLVFVAIGLWNALRLRRQN